MKQISFIILLLLANSSSSTYTQDALDYILRCIEYEASVTGGTLSVILYDLASNPFDNILNAILQSPRLEHVVKYVVNGTYQENMVNLPRDPSMLLIHPGYNVTHLMLPNVIYGLNTVLKLFNPTAKALVFVDFDNLNMLRTIFGRVFHVGFVSMVFFDSVALQADLWNRVTLMRWTRVPPPMYLFTWIRRSMTGLNITYYAEELSLNDLDWNVRWVKEVARYLNTEASQYGTFCDDLTGNALIRCLKKQRHELDIADLRLQIVTMRPDISREFAALSTGAPLIMRIAIPRDRPLNVAELMLMPFKWNTWLLLVSVLALAEITKQLFPNLFRNNPTLHVVCGFERQSIHRAGPLEKIILLSLIILVFFTSNAFETKMLALMVSKSSIQRIKTPSDLLKSDIKFHGDLESKPYLVNQTMFGQKIVQGTISVYDTIPGVGIMITQEFADILDLTAFNYERMQPWYVLLDYESLNGYNFFQTCWRYQNVDIFSYVYNLLTQAGLMDHWKRRYTRMIRDIYVGSRQRDRIEGKVDLNFEDMKPAWAILAIGLNVSLVAFIGEYISKCFKIWLNVNIRKGKQVKG